VSGLDPRRTAERLFQEGATAREAFIYKMNHLEPPFPYKVVAFIPGIFGLEDIQADDPSGRTPRI
jgi:hypothetical protein